MLVGLSAINTGSSLFGGGDEEKVILKRIADPNLKVLPSGRHVILWKKNYALISNLDVMLSMDSGNGHLAAMYGVPTITLWGVTHPYAGFAPFDQPEENQLYADRNQVSTDPTSVYGNKFPEGYENAMETISPESIFKRSCEIL